MHHFDPYRLRAYQHAALYLARRSARYLLRWFTLGLLMLGISYSSVARSGTVPAAAQTAAWSCVNPGDWIGQYPQDRAAKSKRTFFQLNCVQTQLKAILSARDFKALRTTLRTGVPISQQGSVLKIQLCEPHNCRDHGMIFLLDAVQDQYLIRFEEVFDRDQAARQRSQTTFYTKGVDLAHLPAAWQAGLSAAAAH